VKLEGSLDAFSLPDIFQLLSFTKKSGALHLRRATLHGCVYFRDGAVTSATSDETRQGLGRRLIALSGHAAISEDQLDAAINRCSAEEIGIGRALVDAGAVDVDVVRGLIGEQAVDAVFDFLRWHDGDFSFNLDETSPDDVGVLLAVEGLVENARARLEAWDRACSVIPAPDSVLALPVTVDADPQVGRDDWGLLALIDGRRSVAEVVALAGRGDFAAVSGLAALVERGLLVVRDEQHDEGAAALARRQAILARLETRAGVAPTSFATSQAEAPVADDVDEPVLVGELEDDVAGTSTIPTVLAAAAAPVREVEPSMGARLVADTRATVVPARPEPFTPRRRPDFPEDAPRTTIVTRGGAVMAGAAVAAQAEDAAEPRTHIERDPSVNKSLLLRLIAGVRGL